MNKKETSGETLNLPVSAYIHFEDPRYKTLILRGSFGTVGYSILSDGSLKRVCICHAYSDNECICGRWDIKT